MKRMAVESAKVETTNLDTFLPPIEKPKSLMMKLAYYFTRKQFGKVLTPLKVHSARLPIAFGQFYAKVSNLDKKLQLPPETVLLIREQVKVASFAQAPRQDLIAALKDAGVLVMPSIGARRHAEKVAAWGVDAVLVQGGEGGGHTGSVPTTLLLPQVVDAVDIPVIAAGGFFDGRGLVAALAYGAVGIAMGTRFLLTSDSRVPELVKGEYLKRAVTDTVVTREVDGQPHRVLNTEFVDKLEHQVPGTGLITALRNGVRFRKESGLSILDMLREGRAMRKSQDLSWSQVVMAANTVMFLKRALVEGRTDVGVFPTGQVVGMIEDLPSCQELIDRIIAEADKVLTRLNG